MNIQTSGATAGRNLYHWFGDKEKSNGSVEIKTGKTKEIWLVKQGDIVGYDEYTGKSKVKEVRYGQYIKEWKRGKLTREDKVKSGTNLALVPTYHIEKSEIEFLGEKATLFNRMYGGSLRKQTIKYKGGKIAFELSRYSKRPLEIKYKNGKIYAKLVGEIDEGEIISKTYDWKGENRIIETHNQVENTEKDKGEWQNIFRGQDASLEIFDKEGKVRCSGKIQNRQRVGEWIENYEKTYYLQGVKVSKNIFDGKIEPREVLLIENAQLRASLIGKLGLERIVKECEGKVIDTDTERGYELISLPIKARKPNFTSEQVDKEMRVLKVKCPSTNVYYCLRVPPNMEKCEQARQWTLGVNQREKALVFEQES